MSRSRLLELLLVSLSAVGSAVGQPPGAARSTSVRAGGIEFRFASAESARDLLSERGAFVDRMSPFDRQSRMQADRDPGVDSYLDFVAAEARDWPVDGRDALRRTIELLDERLGALQLPEIGPIMLAHTTGREESGAAYTRGSTIVLPPRHAGASGKPKLRLIAHELFHVLSRSHPQLRNELYQIIGFRHVGPIAIPDQLQDRIITNPDAPAIEHVIDLQLADGTAATVAPLLYSESDYSADKGLGMFGYMKFRLMEVAPDDQGQWAAKLDDGKPILHEPTMPDFHRQIGGNTGYIIHPEEILADNFAALATGAAVQDAWLTDKMRKAFESNAEQPAGDEQ